MPILNPNVSAIYILWRKGENGGPIRAYEEETRGNQDLTLLKTNSTDSIHFLDTIMLYKRTQPIP